MEKRYPYNIFWLLALYPFPLGLILSPCSFPCFFTSFVIGNFFITLADWLSLKKHAPSFVWVIISSFFPFFYLLKRSKITSSSQMEVWLSCVCFLMAGFLLISFRPIDPLPPKTRQIYPIINEDIIRSIGNIQIGYDTPLKDMLLSMADGKIENIKWSFDRNLYVIFIEKKQTLGVLMFQRIDNMVELVKVVINNEQCATTNPAEQIDCFIKIKKAQ